MKAETLKKSILQYAMQGKLVAQDPNDEPASELLKRIKAEKDQLIKDGKIKKEKSLPPIAEDEIPYELPHGWEWVKVQDLLYLKSGDTIAQGLEIQNGDLLYLKVGDMNLNIKYVDKSSRSVNSTNINKNSIIPPRSIIFPKRGGAIATNKKQITLKPILVDLNVMAACCLKDLNIEYLYYWFLSFDLSALNTGTSVPQINNKDIYPLLFPLPPLAEQQRIVEKLEQILPLVDEYGKNEEKLSKLNSTLPDKIKQSILQHAVQGKLVSQNFDDEPASELLKRIKAEKEQLIKDGKIKKEKPLPPITEDEIPYELPQGWEWVRLSQITSIIGDGIHGTPEYTLNTEYYFINGNNLNNGIIEIKDNTKTVSETEYLKYKKDLTERTVLVSINGTLGNVAFYNNEKVMLGKSACYLNLLVDINKAYIKLFLNSDYFLTYADNKATGTTIKNVSLKAMNDLLIPLPPIVEQQRIVTKVEELLSIVESLKV